jgi:hypothetical protein
MSRIPAGMPDWIGCNGNRARECSATPAGVEWRLEIAPVVSLRSTTGYWL